jgi:hypothetical protein
MNRYKQREDSSPLPGAAYIRVSSEMQSDSFSLDAQLSQIKEQADSIHHAPHGKCCPPRIDMRLGFHVIPTGVYPQGYFF